jgi:hypothetical protein
MFPPNAPWLIYNQDRTFERRIAAARVPAPIHKAMGGRAKIYCDLLVSGPGLTFIARVQDEAW